MRKSNSIVKPGEIFWAVVPDTSRRPVIIVSRHSLNRGDQVVVIPLTTAHWERRKKLPNCVAFQAGEFGLNRDCVAQAERIACLQMGDLDFSHEPIGELDASRFRELVRAIGYMIDADCEPI